MKSLPPTATLARAILKLRRGNTTVAESCEYLTQHRAALEKYEDVEHFALTDDPSDAKLRRAVEHHLINLRAGLARELWSRQLFIGVSVLDDLLFRGVVHHAWDRPVERLLEVVRDKALHSPGLVVFPVHSFGVLGAGLLHWRTDARAEYAAPAFGIALSPQTNSLQESGRFLVRAKQALGIRRHLPMDLVEHWHRSRGATWLTRNPLLVVRVRSFPGDYYENQFLLLAKLRASTSLLSMLASMQPPSDSRDSRIWSSSTVNNFQTLDMRHYLVFFAHPGKRKVLAGDCVPMHLDPAALAEVSSLGFDLDLPYWSRRRGIAVQVFEAVERVHAGYIKHSFGGMTASVHGRVFRKLFHALSFFRRSFQRADENWLAPVSLAVAFEMMLTDRYSPGVNRRVVRRARLLLQGIAGSRKLTRAVEALYDVRSEIVHSGAAVTQVDLTVARRAFVLAFATMSVRLPSLATTSNSPAQDLCRDPRG